MNRTRWRDGVHVSVVALLLCLLCGPLVCVAGTQAKGLAASPELSGAEAVALASEIVRYVVANPHNSEDWQWVRVELPDRTLPKLMPGKSGTHRFCTLKAYVRVSPPAGDTISSKMLFIPFTDETNSEETYGGGRYIDIPISAVKDGFVILDFNKAYNPYCAFGEGFSCPIPPEENHLELQVKAGERNWAKPQKD